jgi:pimeloyl-ACP methyl ester carboxylesterase
MSTLAYTRTGAGEPVVLLHGIGMARGVWDPVIPALAARFDVIAVDLPGFGESLAPAEELTPARLAAAVAELLDDLAVAMPHLVGNSLGGWTALELAALVPAASVTLLSPAGFWRKHTPLYCRVSLRASRWLARRLGRPLARLVSWRLGRVLVLGQTHGRPTKVPADVARRTVREMGTCPGFESALRATARTRYVPPAPIACPVTVAFGSRDWLLRPRQSRHLDQLPAGCSAEILPRCGHVPMADDPFAVAAFIAAGIDATASAIDAASPPISARRPTRGAALRPGR